MDIREWEEGIESVSVGLGVVDGWGVLVMSLVWAVAEKGQRVGVFAERSGRPGTHGK